MNVRGPKAHGLNVHRIVITYATALVLAAPATVAAQTGTGTANEGALELILPIGARTVGMGMTGASASSGSEAPWWNPALVARSPRDAALQVQSNVNAQATADVAGVVVYPLPPVGTVALTIRYIGYGAIPAFDKFEQQTGTFTLANSNIGVTFATTVSHRVAAGFTLKRLVYLVNCSGDCQQLTNSPSASALDFGAHAFVVSDSTLSVGVTVRNIGPKLQVRDSPQADPLPGRGTIGIAYMPRLTGLEGVRVTVAGDIVQALAGGSSPGYRIGGEVTYLNKYKGRAGYIMHGPGELGGPTLGGGLVSGKLQIDFAQMLTDVGSGSSRPLLISLRYVF